MQAMTNLTTTSIDRLGARLRLGDASEADLRLLDAYRRSFADGYAEVIATVRRIIRSEPTGRPSKSTTSIVEKLGRETIRLSQMQDIAGCRVVVPDIQNQDEAIQLITNALPTTHVIDRRTKPTHGYRAVHIVAAAQAKPIEIQIRTTEQHLWAELSEKLADVVDPNIKYGKGPAKYQDVLKQLSGLIAGAEDLDIADFPLPDDFRVKARNFRHSVRGLVESAIFDIEILTGDSDAVSH